MAYNEFNFNNNSSLAGFGYQDPMYSAYDGYSSPSYVPAQNYSSSSGNVIANDPLSAIKQAADKNNQWSAEQAANQNAFQVQQNEKAMNFSAEQAALNRSWQEEMSNTAHQREVIDLQKAGLNPVLSATGGNGATVGSGASAAGVTSAGAKGDTDESLTMALMSYMAQQMSAQTSIMNTQTSANATLANAELMSSASRYAADLNYALGMNDPERYVTGVIKDVVDPYIGGFGQKVQNSAASAANDVRSWVADVYNGFVKSESKGHAGGTTVNSNNGSHSSGNFHPASGSTEKAIANARAVLANAAESSGLNLWKAIDKATNGSLSEKAKNAKK